MILRPFCCYLVHGKTRQEFGCTARRAQVRVRVVEVLGTGQLPLGTSHGLHSGLPPSHDVMDQAFDPPRLLHSAGICRLHRRVISQIDHIPAHRGQRQHILYALAGVCLERVSAVQPHDSPPICSKTGTRSRQGFALTCDAISSKPQSSSVTCKGRFDQTCCGASGSEVTRTGSAELGRASIMRHIST